MGLLLEKTVIRMSKRDVVFIFFKLLVSVKVKVLLPTCTYVDCIYAHLTPQE